MAGQLILPLFARGMMVGGEYFDAEKTQNFYVIAMVVGWHEDRAYVIEVFKKRRINYSYSERPLLTTR